MLSILTYGRHQKILAMTALATALVGWTPGYADDNPVTQPTFMPEIFDGLGSDPVRLYDISGGTVTEAKLQTFFGSYEKRTGKVFQTDYNPNGAKFFAGVEAGHVPWDVVQLNDADAAKASQMGLLAKIDESIVPVGKMIYPVIGGDRFAPFTNGVIMTWNLDKYPDGGDQPDTIEKFFNVQDYPGNRCLFRSAQGAGVLEAGMAAAGKSNAEIYPITDEAFEQLGKIKDHVVWFQTADEGQRKLKSGDCAMGIIWYNRVYSSVTKDAARLGASFDFAVTSKSLYTIPKDARNMKASQAVLAMMLYDRAAAERYATQTGEVMATTEPLVLPDELQKYAFTKERIAGAIATDAAYYESNIDSLTDKFNEMLLQ